MKKIFLFAATAAIALSSCSKNDVSEIANPNENPNAIGLNVGAFATKSTETLTSTLQSASSSTSGDTNNVTLYSNDTNFGDSGVLKFSYSSSTWSNIGTYTWAGVDFTMSVYSAHDGANVAVTPATGSLSYSVEDLVSKQVDLVYFGQTLSAIPTAGVISATYKHALSRIKMTNLTSSTMTTTVTGVELMGFDGEATATITPATNTIVWSNNAAANLNYAYDLASASTTSNDMYIIPYKTAAFVEDAVTGNLGNAPYTGKSGVTALCVTSVSGTPIAGFADVDDFKDLNPSVESVKVSGVAEEYDGAMYVKAIFPINGVEFIDGKYYNLQLNFAGASIYYYDDNYYTEDGEELVITGDTTTPGPEEGDPINPTATDLIGLTVIVNSWPAVENTTL